MKIRVAGYSRHVLQVMPLKSREPSYLMASVLPEMPIGTRGRFLGTSWRSVKQLTEMAHFHGLRLVKVSK